MTLISAIHFRPYALAFRTPFQTARETLRVRKGWLLWVVDQDGGWGVGEAAPLAGFGMESHRRAGEVIAGWARSLPGRELRLELSAAATAGAENAAFGLLGEPPGGAEARAAPAARHALELALLDLAARRAGLPLARFLHPEAAAAVAVNGVVGGGAAGETARRASELVREGYRTLKFKVGLDTPEKDLERLRAVRESVGPHIRLRLDANGGWRETEALALLEKLAPLTIEYVEQPLPAADLAGMARLARRSPIPLAADEAVVSLKGVRAVLERGAAQLLILKPQPLGGILTALEAARIAADQGVRVVLTTMLDGAVGREGAAAAAAALSAPAPALDSSANGGASTEGGESMEETAHGLATGGLLSEDLVAAPALPAEGRLAVSTAPGLGLALGPPAGLTDGPPPEDPGGD